MATPPPDDSTTVFTGNNKRAVVHKNSGGPADEEISQLTLLISYEISSLLTLLGHAKRKYSSVMAYVKSIRRELNKVSRRIESLNMQLEQEKQEEKDRPKTYTKAISGILRSCKLLFDVYTENKMASDSNRRLLEDSYARTAELNNQINDFSSLFNSSEGKLTFTGDKGEQKLAQFREIGLQYDELMVRLWALQKSMECIENNTTLLTAHVDEVTSQFECTVINNRS